VGKEGGGEVKSTLSKLLCDPSTPKGFRLHIADMLATSRTCSGLDLAAMAHGWNAAMRSMGVTELVDESILPQFLRRLGNSTVSIFPKGCKECYEPQILHPKWRDAIERGEHIPDDESELFSTGLVSERFTPFPVGSPLIDAVIRHHPDGVHALQNEVGVIQVESSAHDDSHSTPASAPSSNPFPTSTHP
jgi:hypothetical protein